MTRPKLDILLTGASGFLGPYVATALATAGHHVRVATRRHEGIALSGDVARVGEFNATTDWRAALSGIGAVVHLAGLAHRNATYQSEACALYHETNVAATLTLARAAAEAGVHHIIFASSIAVNGSSTTGNSIFREDDIPAPKTVYGMTKSLAEIGLSEISAQTGMAVTAIRPPMIYGNGAKGSFGMLSRAIHHRLPLPFASVRNIRAFVAAENVADFVSFILSRAASGFSAVIVADDEQVSTAEFSRRIGLAMSRPAVLLPVPEQLLLTGMRALGTTGLIESVIGSLRVDAGKARNMGWKPALTMNDALQRAVARA